MRDADTVDRVCDSCKKDRLCKNCKVGRTPRRNMDAILAEIEQGSKQLAEHDQN